MHAGAHARTIFAGFGVSGSLLAAIGAAFIVVGSFLAFDRWPAELVEPPVSSVAVAPASGPGAAPAALESIALPAAAPAAPAGPGITSGGPAQGRRDARTPNGPGPRTTPPGPGPAAPPATPPTTPVDVVPAAGAGDNALAAAVESTTGATADGVRSIGAALPITAPVTDLVGGLVDGAGTSVGGLLRDLDR